MDELRYKEGIQWDDHINTFNALLNILPTDEEELSGREKSFKPLREILESLSGFAKITLMQELHFERQVQAMHSEISRRQNVRTFSPTASAADMDSNWNGRFSGDRRIPKQRHKGNDACYDRGKIATTLLIAGTGPIVVVVEGVDVGGFGDRRCRGCNRWSGLGQCRLSYGAQIVGHGPATQYSTNLGHEHDRNIGSVNQGFGTEQHQPQLALEAHPDHFVFSPRRSSDPKKDHFQGIMA